MTDRERVKPWDADRALASAEHCERTADVMGAAEDQAILRGDAATLRAFAAALRLLDAPYMASVPNIEERASFGDGYREGYDDCIKAFAKALRGEEGES